MTAGFGGAGYQAPQQKALSSIAKSPTPDLTSQEKIAQLLQQHSSQIRYLAANQKQLQQGVNDATANPLQQVQQALADVIVLLGGGQLAAGALDFGDLQYILPALGALFGFDSDAPFPISLFEAAEKFFLGYVVPSAQFADVINMIIEQWASVFGIDPEFIKDVKALIDAFGNLFDGLQNLLPSLNELFGALGVSGTDLGPLGQVLGPIIKLFSGIDLENFGDAIEFITSAISPFIEQLTAVINFINSILAVIGYDGGDVVNSPLGETTLPFANLMGLFGDLNFTSPDFDIIDAWIRIVGMIGSALGIPNLDSFLPQLGTAFQGIDLANPGAILSKVTELLSSWKILPWQWGDGIPLGLVSKASRSLVAVGNFPNAASIGDNPFWSFDPDVTSTADGTGSARATADGTQKVLRSVQFPVQEGVAVPARGRFRWRDLVSTGTPLKLGVREFHADGTTTDVTVAQIAAPGTNSADAGHMDFVQLSATYDPPAGVSRVWLRAIVEPTATAGTVWFDEGDADTTDEAPDWLAWLVGLFGLGSLDDAMGGDVDDILSGFISGKLNPLDLLEDNGIRDFVKGMIDQLTSILRLIPFVGDTLGDSLENFADGMEAQNEVVVGTASSLSQLAAAMGGGVPDADDFERTTLGPNWRVIKSNGGSVTVDGHDLIMGHDDDTDIILLKTDKLASTDFQTGEIVLGSAPGFGTVLVDSARGHNDIILRASDFTTWATRTMIRCRWSAQNQNVEITAWVNGSKVATIFNGALQSATSGSRMMLECGVLGVPRQYIVRINGAIAKDVVESGTASQLGAGFRRRGLGGATEHLGVGGLAISPDPGKVKSWAVTG